MAVITDWSNPRGGPVVYETNMTMDVPNNTTEYTNAYPKALPKKSITLYAEATGALNGQVSINLQGSYDGTNYVTLVSNIISGTTLVSPAAGTFDLDQYSGLKYRLEVTTTMAETEDMSIYLIFEREV